MTGCATELTLLPIIDVQQETSFTCGPAAAKSVLLFYGIDTSESYIASVCGSSDKSGTSPEQLVRGFSEFGLKALIKDSAKLSDLAANLRDSLPTLVAVQAWVDSYPPTSWENNWEDGHWLVVIGMDEYNIYFEDPSLLGSRGFLTKDEFLSRWHDYVGEEPCCDTLDMKRFHLAVTVFGEPISSMTHIK